MLPAFFSSNRSHRPKWSRAWGLHCPIEDRFRGQLTLIVSRPLPFLAVFLAVFFFEVLMRAPVLWILRIMNLQQHVFLKKHLDVCSEKSQVTWWRPCRESSLSIFSPWTYPLNFIGRGAAGLGVPADWSDHWDIAEGVEGDSWGEGYAVVWCSCFTSSSAPSYLAVLLLLLLAVVVVDDDDDDYYYDDDCSGRTFWKWTICISFISFS